MEWECGWEKTIFAENSVYFHLPWLSSNIGAEGVGGGGAGSEMRRKRNSVRKKQNENKNLETNWDMTIKKVILEYQ